MNSGGNQEELQRLAQELAQHKADFSQWRQESYDHRAELYLKLALLNDDVTSLNDYLSKMRKEIKDILKAWSGVKGGVLFFWAVGRVVKWITAVVLLVSSVVYFLNGLSPPGK